MSAGDQLLLKIISDREVKDPDELWHPGTAFVHSPAGDKYAARRMNDLARKHGHPMGELKVLDLGGVRVTECLWPSWYRMWVATDVSAVRVIHHFPEPRPPCGPYDLRFGISGVATFEDRDSALSALALYSARVRKVACDRAALPNPDPTPLPPIVRVAVNHAHRREMETKMKESIASPTTEKPNLTLAHVGMGRNRVIGAIAFVAGMAFENALELLRELPAPEGDVHAADTFANGLAVVIGGKAPQVEVVEPEPASGRYLTWKRYRNEGHCDPSKNIVYFDDTGTIWVQAGEWVFCSTNEGGAPTFYLQFNWLVKPTRRVVLPTSKKITLPKPPTKKALAEAAAEVAPEGEPEASESLKDAISN